MALTLCHNDIILVELFMHFVLDRILRRGRHGAYRGDGDRAAKGGSLAGPALRIAEFIGRVVLGIKRGLGRARFKRYSGDQNRRLERGGKARPRRLTSFSKQVPKQVLASLPSLIR
jgi:hypothetical protein